MGLDSVDADLDRPDDITNPFDFNMWQSAPVEPFGIKNTKSLEIVLYETSTNVELQNSNELSSLKTADFYGTLSTVDSTGNAPQNPSTQPVRHIITDKVYTNLVQLSTKEVMDIKSNKNNPKQLTQVTIMVVVLEPLRKGTYVTYPYLELHGYRVLIMWLARSKSW